MINRLLILLCLLMASYMVIAQDSSAVVTTKVVAVYIKDINKRAGHLHQTLDKKSAKALQQMQRQEAKLKKKIARLDSLKAKEIFGNAEQQYEELEKRLRNGSLPKNYIARLDTMSTSLRFLQQNQQLFFNSLSGDGIQKKLTGAMNKIAGLEGQFQKAEEIKKFLKERKEFLKNHLSKFGLANELKKMSKEVYYYGQTITEIKTTLQDARKTERKAIELLSKTRQFQNFMRKNSMLASLFRLPGDPDDPVNTASLAGLQTRAQVNGLIQQQIAAGGPIAQAQFQQNLQGAQSQLTALKNKINQLGAASSDAEMPEGFKPNNQKTKSFLKRLELGTNIQSQKANGYFPVTSDLGLSVGYKLNDKSIIGIGASYKLGWGQNIRHINITHQGAGLRSFVDWKIKGSFWISGGYEMNYRSDFENIDVLKDLNAWQQSGLVGLSKVISLKTKFFKKTKLQLLWDFLSYQQVPRTQPVLFRVGYNF